ncbi:MAG: ABC transporter permease [Clostridia bacterium]|nr:ABC transporter permease [Clostridia bacterium]
MREWLKNEKTVDRIAPFVAVLFGLIVGVFLILFTKNSPIDGFKYLLQGGIGLKDGQIDNLQKIGKLLLEATPLILAGLAVGFSFRTGIFNIGVSGQMLIGGLAATVIGTQFEMARAIQVPLVIIAAGLAGALWAFIPAILKAKYKVNEVVTTIMMNYIALEVVAYFIRNIIQSPHFDTESAKVLPSATLRIEWLYNMFDRANLNIGIFISLAIAAIYAFVLNKTTFGYELKAVGHNKDASEYAGIKVNTRILQALMISGGMAGLAGVTFYLGNTDHIAIGQLPSYGFDGIVIALLGLNSAIGIILASLLLAFFNVGSGAVKANLVNNVPNQLVPMMIAVIIYFSATALLFKNFIKKLATGKKKGGAK